MGNGFTNGLPLFHVIRRIASKFNRLRGRTNVGTSVPSATAGHLNQVQHPPLTLVYQMGKVGSSSVYGALAELPQLETYHTHRLNPENIEKAQAHALGAGVEFRDKQDVVSVFKHAVSTQRPIKIISLIREPVSRNFSAYFENLENFKAQAHVSKRSFDLPPLIDTFVKDYSHGVPLIWFDTEIKATTGIDIFATPFPKQQGYNHYRLHNFELLLMRHNLDDEKKAKLLCEFLELPELKIKRRNIGENKVYSAAYREFLSQITLPASYLDRMLNSKYAQHLFLESEIKAIRTRWSHKTV